MKTAVSLPDGLFRRAEAAARKMRVSRSQLYATAIAEFLQRTRDESITARLNEVYAGHTSTVESALHDVQLQSLDRDKW